MLDPFNLFDYVCDLFDIDEMNAFVVAIGFVLFTMWWWRQGKLFPDSVEERPAQRKSYWPPYFEAAVLQKGLESGVLHQGQLSIYRGGRDKAWVRGIAALKGEDLFLDGERAQNRGLDGDVVAVDLQKAVVVGIVERKHRRAVVGILRRVKSGEDTKGKGKDKGKGKGRGKSGETPYAQLEFMPNDRRFPILKIPGEVLESCDAALVIARRMLQQESQLYDEYKRIPKTRQAELKAQFQVLSGASGVNNVSFEPTLTAFERRYVHSLAAELGLVSESHGEADQRHIVVTKPGSQEVELQLKSDGPATSGPEMLFAAVIHSDWLAQHRWPAASALQCLGLCTEPETHERAILIENSIHDEDPSPEVLEECTKSEEEFESSFEGRRDFRDETIFSIDPAGAKDLDDALHIRTLPDTDAVEVGIHIADVSYWVKEESSLDKHAKDRCATTYLTTLNCPMLPRPLSENLCSLTGGCDRLTFSIVVHLSADGAVVREPWFGRGVIHSRGKLSYEQAQEILDAADAQQALDICRTAEHLTIKRDASDVVDALKRLSIVAKALLSRASNRNSGSTRPSFTFSKETGLVTLDSDGGTGDPAEEAHRLVECFMLLANRLVAEKLAACVPSRALLRAHLGPRADRLTAWGAHCAPHAADVCSVKLTSLVPDELHVALRELEAGATTLHETNPERAAGLRALIVMVTRTMASSQYVCGCSAESNHWGLDMTHYTHFTSPIRRYADLLVHRELAAILESTAAVDGDQLAKDALQRQVDLVNSCSQLCSRAQQDSNEIFMVRWFEQQGPLKSAAVILSLSDRFATVLVSKIGIEVNCRYDTSDCLRHELARDADGLIKKVTFTCAGCDGLEELVDLSELSVCQVELSGQLARHPILKATLVLRSLLVDDASVPPELSSVPPEPSSLGIRSQSAGANSSEELDGLLMPDGLVRAKTAPAVLQLARSASNDLGDVLTRMSSEVCAGT